MESRRLQKAARDDLPGSELVKFAKSLASKQLPAGWWLPDTGDWVDTSDPSKVAVDFRQINQSGQLGVCYRLPVGQLHESVLKGDADGATPEAKEAAAAALKLVEEFQARVASSNQMHNHSHRCKKGHHRGDDDDCAMFKPEVARAAPEVLEGGCMLLQCDHGMLVPHCPAIMLV